MGGAKVKYCYNAMVLVFINANAIILLEYIVSKKMFHDFMKYTKEGATLS